LFGFSQSVAGSLYNRVFALCVVAGFLIPALASAPPPFEASICALSDASAPLTGDKNAHHPDGVCARGACAFGYNAAAVHSDAFVIPFRRSVARLSRVMRSDALRSFRIIFFTARGPPRFSA